MEFQWSFRAQLLRTNQIYRAHFDMVLKEKMVFLLAWANTEMNAWSHSYQPLSLFARSYWGNGTVIFLILKIDRRGISEYFPSSWLVERCVPHMYCMLTHCKKFPCQWDFGWLEEPGEPRMSTDTEPGVTQKLWALEVWGYNIKQLITMPRSPSEHFQLTYSFVQNRWSTWI